MEISVKKVKSFFLNEAKPFTSKRDLNLGKIYITAGLLLGVTVFVILVWPSPKPVQTTFYEKAENGTLVNVATSENDPTLETVRQLQDSQSNTRSVHASLDHLYQKDDTGNSFSNGSSTQKENSASMILSRNGTDTKTQLLSGTRIHIRISEKISIAGQSIPVLGIVSKDVISDYGMAIPSGSKILGDASFDETNERAHITWRSIIMLDGRERPFSALGLNQDGQIGISGDVKSDGMKNALGQTLTRFVGAYAAGSMNTGSFGANQGGNVNGVRNAIAQTATDKANAMGEELQKERKWIEIDGGTETLAVLNQPFVFRDAGATHVQ